MNPIHKKLHRGALLLILALGLVSLTACQDFLNELGDVLDEYALTAEAEMLTVEAEETPPAAPQVRATPTAAVPVEETPTATPILVNPNADFDFYVMALSWSPDYCASNGDNDPQQCSTGKKMDFVLHGLWPQYDKGYPSDCSNERMPDELEDQYPGLYPNTKLYDHEWEKHGTCSGLTPEGYLELSKRLKDSLNIPAAYQKPEQPFRVTTGDLQTAFTDANPDFEASSFATYCSGSGRFLKELFVCFEIDGSPRPCSSEILQKAAKSCGQADFLVRSVR